MNAFYKQICPIWLCFLFVLEVSAQDTIIERFSQNFQEDNVDGENVIQELLLEAIDLNSALPAELYSLPFLTSSQIDSFISIRKRFTYFENLDHALRALRVSGDTLAFCRQVFRLSMPKEPISWNAAGRWRIGRPEKIDEKWQGMPYRLYNRIGGQVGEFNFGTLTEQDPGEKRLDDYRSMFVSWRHQHHEGFFHAILGAYQVEWGHGLAFWGPYGNSISTDVHAAARRRGRGIRNNSSVNENSALRGLALQHAWDKIKAIVFVSSQQHDATLRDETVAIGYRTSGYHRTENETAQRDNLRENVFGGGIKFSPNSLAEIGVLFYQSQFDKAWHIRNQVSDFFDFIGKQNHVLSFIANVKMSSVDVGLELARSEAGGKAFSLVLSQQGNFLGWTGSYHHYDVHFHSPHGRSINEFAKTPQGNSGYSVGIAFKPLSSLHGEIYYRRTQDLWGTQRQPFPPNAQTFGAKLEAKIASRSRLNIRYRRNQKDELAQTSGEIQQQSILPVESHTMRLELKHRAGKYLVLSPRWDLAFKQEELITNFPNLQRMNQQTATGSALSFGFTWTPTRRWLIHLRHVFFDSPLAIYQYERDLPGVFTIRALRESGTRRYIYLRFKLLQKMTLSYKFACTELDDLFGVQRNYSWGFQIDLKQ